MRLIELLNKRKNGEDLTEEELAILKEYDDSVAVHLSEIERIKTEKELAESKLSTVDTELKEKSKQLSEKEEALKRELDEKETMKKILENTNSTHEAKLEMERQKADKERKDELAREKAKADALREKEEEERKAQLKELADIKEQLAINSFEKKVLSEKTRRPYLEKQLDRVLTEIQVKGLEKSQMALEVMLELYNHDEEMAKWEANKQKSTDIFTPKETKVVETPTPVNTKDKEEQEKAKVLEFAKKNGFRVFNKK
jgi:chromosome segregation ATPase